MRCSREGLLLLESAVGTARGLEWSRLFRLGSSNRLKRLQITEKRPAWMQHEAGAVRGFSYRTPFCTCMYCRHTRNWNFIHLWINVPWLLVVYSIRRVTFPHPPPTLRWCCLLARSLSSISISLLGHLGTWTPRWWGYYTEQINNSLLLSKSPSEYVHSSFAAANLLPNALGCQAGEPLNSLCLSY